MSDDDEKTLAMSFVAAALLTISVQLVVVALVGITDAMRPGAAADIVNLSACQLVVHLGFILLVARLYARDTSLRHLLGLRPLSPLVLVLCVVAGAAFEMPISFVERAWAAAVRPSFVLALADAPWDRRRSTVVNWPCSAALIKAVQPFSMAIFGSDPASRSAWTLRHGCLLLRAAHMSTVCPP